MILVFRELTRAGGSAGENIKTRENIPVSTPTMREKQKIAAEMKDCTFRPNTTKSRKKKKKPPV